MWPCLSAFLAGAVNSVAGGGTLLTFPVLVAAFAGFPEPMKLANATSTVALFPGAMAGVWGYRAELAGQRAWVQRLLWPSLVGAAIGSVLIAWLPEDSFRAVVPWLILSATLLFLFQPLLTRRIPATAPDPLAQQGVPNTDGATTTRPALAIFIQFCTAVYGGYFGAGIGILMLSVLGILGMRDIHQMNGVKSLLAATINGVAVAVFVTTGTVIWSYAIPMLLAAVAGGYLGARIARKLNRQFVRGVVVTIGFGLAVYYFSR